MRINAFFAQAILDLELDRHITDTQGCFEYSSFEYKYEYLSYDYEYNTHS